jgi:hypothetical protein
MPARRAAFAREYSAAGRKRNPIGTDSISLFFFIRGGVDGRPRRAVPVEGSGGEFQAARRRWHDSRPHARDVLAEKFVNDAVQSALLLTLPLRLSLRYTTASKAETQVPFFLIFLSKLILCL